MGSLSPLQGNLPDPGIEPRSPALQADSLPVEPQGKPKNTGVCSIEVPIPSLADLSDPGIDQGSNLEPPVLEGKVLTTGPPEIPPFP